MRTPPRSAAGRFERSGLDRCAADAVEGAGPGHLGTATSPAPTVRRERGPFDPEAARGESSFGHTVWVLASDGELEEGISREASSLDALCAAREETGRPPRVALRTVAEPGSREAEATKEAMRPDPELRFPMAAEGLARTRQVGERVRLDRAEWNGREWFGEQRQGYRGLVRPPRKRVRVSVEAGSALGWQALPGDVGQAVCPDGFGASARYQALDERHALTAERLATAARASAARATAARVRGRA
ncbi:transketolase-like TK C-terminal-containing protein [Streptomyces sp. NPDC051109]|uniref:transketolase-like TK C-terminal-containing protein n=1 Tax=Streptomyces sp. NPDC051109 TaxID=3365642 RepID=UPI0037B5C51A